FSAARLGVYIHGLAGDLAAKETGEVSLLAGDIMNAIPTAVRFLVGT
ncbi:MAG: ACP synthase, partial [bacterium (Candidatus Ratteibacteria) CG23_combo_of_CG06-09_8_20_14_all_48_7]